MRVLVLEDDPVIAQLHADIVDKHGRCELVGRALTGAAALAFVQANPVDLILADMVLPDMTGIAVLQRLRAAGYITDAIMLTAAGDLETVQAARSLGVSDYLVKPFAPAELVRRLERHADALVARSQIVYAPGGNGALDQSHIDALWQRPASDIPAVPKGLAAPTLTKVRAFASEAANPITAQQVADALGMSRVSARRYLEHLAATGHMIIEPRYGSSGRPVLEYRLAGADR